MVRTMRAYQLTKNGVLLESIRRIAYGGGNGEELAIVDAAAKTLAGVQAENSAVAARLLISPQFSSWAIECLLRLRGLLGPAGSAALPPLSAHVGYMATVAAAAAMRARHEFDLEVPLSDGWVSFPTLGTVRLDAQDRARARLSGQRAVVSAGSCSVTLPGDFDGMPRGEGKRWTPTPRLRAQAGGLSIRLDIETRDPLVKRFGAAIQPITRADYSLWQRYLAKAWRILVRHHRPTAEAIAGVLTTIVPLSEPHAERAVSATSGWAWGAVALSLPPDPVSLAETLVHELHHTILGALEDMTTLIAADDEARYYAPWRDDARPLPELLQGCYAHLGVTRFWLRQRNFGFRGARRRGDVEFARRCPGTFSAAATIAMSDALSDLGRLFAVGMRDRVAEWLREPVWQRAEAIASEIALEHRVRWRLAYVQPNPVVTNELARAWLAGSARPPDSGDPPVVAEPGHSLPATRSRLLELRYRDRSSFRRSLRADTALDEADIALLRGDDAAAERLYLQRIAAGDDPDAWAGLAVVKHRMCQEAAPRSLLEYPEVVAALHRRVRELRGTAVDPDSLSAWLGR
jgi:HEXXH motif-containing protein